MFLCQFILRILLLLKNGMGIKDKKICKLWGFTEKFDFRRWFIKKTINRGDFLKKEGLDGFQI